MKTAEALAWWHSHTQRGGGGWAQSYLDTWQMPHRLHVLTALALLHDLQITSLFEIGAASGPNLRLIQSYIPEMQLGGVDQAILDPHLGIRHGVLPECLLDCPKADVYLSMYTLAYLDPEDVRVAMLRMENRAKKAIILCEPMPLPGQPEGQHRVDLPESRHEYTRYTTWKTAWRWPIDPMKEALNTCLILQP